ncbi:hypothetical protein Zmor_010000 [Zophobas morio]|uniref:Uncharacterized protein n=1 Tax=Zophobas morio TaxID=2755281 RepID=A0AA38IN51_9CUCU|nr:hypothetical protein Zmor_010000 [Zophobas morio]
MVQFKDLQKLVASIRTDFEKKFDQLKSDFDTLLSALKNSFPAPPPSKNFEEVVQEVVDRQKRKRNLLIFGIPEQENSLSSTVRAEGDCAAVGDLLKLLTRILISTFKSFKIGSTQS